MTTIVFKLAIKAATLLLALSAGTIYADTCVPSKWGQDDEIGSANLITPEHILMSAKLIKQGKTKNLGITIDSSTPAFEPRTLSLQIIQPGQEYGRPAFPNGFVYNDDVFQGWFGIGSQIDGLAHVGINGEFYNCNKGVDFVHTTGVARLGIEKIPPIVGRAVVLDIAGHFEVSHLEGGQYFSTEDVVAIAKKQNTPIGKGDIVLFYTGWTDHMLTADPKQWGSVEPGMAEDVATYLADPDVLAVGADTWGVDVVPPEKEGRPFQGHITLIKENASKRVTKRIKI